MFNSISHTLTYLLLGAAAALGGLLIAVAYDLRRKARELRELREEADKRLALAAAAREVRAQMDAFNADKPKNKGGRPKGSKNKPKTTARRRA